MSGQDTKPGATMFQVFFSMLTKVHDPVFADIDFAVDVAKRRSHLRVPGYIDQRGEPILNPGHGRRAPHPHRAGRRIRIQGGGDRARLDEGDRARSPMNWPIPTGSSQSCTSARTASFIERRARMRSRAALRRERWLHHCCVGWLITVRADALGRITACMARPWAWTCPAWTCRPDLNPGPPGTSLFLFAMWAVMMVGMMTPSVAPMVLIYQRVAQQANAGGQPSRRSAGSSAAICWRGRCLPRWPRWRSGGWNPRTAHTDDEKHQRPVRRRAAARGGNLSMVAPEGCLPVAMPRTAGFRAAAWRIPGRRARFAAARIRSTACTASAAAGR